MEEITKSGPSGSLDIEGIGYVNFTVYFGTYYDAINIPWDSQQIAREATDSKTYNGYYVWQSTWLSTIVINLETDFQEIVGAQYVEMTDIGTEYPGNHWYTVLGYQNLNNGACELYLEYNPYLTLPFSMMSGYNWSCSGTFNRWTVDDDSTYRWIQTPEPVDLAAPLVYTYKRYDPTSDDTIPLVGFPYMMSTAPTVETYGDSGVYYPKLNKVLESEFTIKTDYGTKTSKDGLAYYYWDSTAPCYENYNLALALGMDIICQGYKLPVTSLIPELASLSPGQRAIKLTGSYTTWDPQLSLADGGFANAKTGYTNIFLTLYNEASGDSVTVNSYELSTDNVTVGANPYITGGFWARFQSYLKNTAGDTGVVKAPPWEALTVSSTTNYNAASNLLAIYAAKDLLSVQHLQTQQNIEREYTATKNNIQTQTLNSLESNYTSQGNSLIGAIGSLLGALGGNVGSAASGAISGIQSTMSFDTAESIRTRTAQTARDNALEARNMARDHENQLYNAQMAILNYQGNLGQCQPPLIKYAQSGAYNANTFTFCVRRAAPAYSDRQRIDHFFTAYGYNVNGLQLTSFTQLKCRKRFVFAQVDNFKYTPYNPANNTHSSRVLDDLTRNYLTNMMARGVRIWRTKPDFDYSISNPIGD